MRVAVYVRKDSTARVVDWCVRQGWSDIDVYEDLGQPGDSDPNTRAGWRGLSLRLGSYSRLVIAEPAELTRDVATYRAMRAHLDDAQVSLVLAVEAPRCE